MPKHRPAHTNDSREHKKSFFEKRCHQFSGVVVCGLQAKCNFICYKSNSDRNPFKSAIVWFFKLPAEYQLQSITLKIYLHQLQMICALTSIRCLCPSIRRPVLCGTSTLQTFNVWSETKIKVSSKVKDPFSVIKACG